MTMKTIVTHPANYNLLKSTMQSVAARDINGVSISPEFRIKVDPYMERYRLTGRFVLPDGRVVERGQVRVYEPFASYGPEDIDYLLYSGWIDEDREMVFFVFDDSAFKMKIDLGPIIHEPRTVLTGGSF